MPHRVLFAPEAQQDLFDLYDYIADQSGARNAISEVGRLERYCRGFVTFPERGRLRDDIRPGLRIVGFERRATIAFHINENAVVIDRILYRGRNVETELRKDA